MCHNVHKKLGEIMCTINYIKYNKDVIESRHITNLLDFNKTDANFVNWLHIDDFKIVKDLNELLVELNVDSFVIENIYSANSGVVVQFYDDYLFMRISYPDSDDFKIKDISFLLFSDKLISLSEEKVKVFDAFVDKLHSHSIYRSHKIDFLFVGLLDILVENYFVNLEVISDEIDAIEDELLSNPSKAVLAKIYYQKRELIEIRSYLWPLRNIISEITRFSHELISEDANHYFNDVYNKVIQLIDIIETYHELGSGMLDTYLSSIGNKTNEVMKVLTIFSTIFIPLSFLAGVFGMNFTYFPGLHSKYGYLGFWVISIVITLIMLRYFKRKDWF